MHDTSQALGPTVDVAINYYGKPYQTAVTIASLMEHSGRHIGRIYLTVEAAQPAGAERIHDILAAHDWPVVVRRPRLYYGWRQARVSKLFGSRAWRVRTLRHSVRYQMALEESSAPYMLLTHNDMRFTRDVIGEMLPQLQQGGHAGVGIVGVCWKCPAAAAELCTDRRYDGVALTGQEWQRLYRDHPHEYRTGSFEEDLLRRPAPPQPSPPIECRLNEWLALIDTAIYRSEVVPAGSAEPIGSMLLGDTGIAWFRDMVHRGHTFGHYADGHIHGGWLGAGAGGHRAMLDQERYDAEEAIAAAYYRSHYEPS